MAGMADTEGTSHRTIIERLEAAMKDVEASRKICRAPSVSLGVLHEGRPIFEWSSGLRDVEASLKADADTSYFIASCSKIFTSTAIALLSDKELSWTDKVHDHLPDFEPTDDPRIGEEATLIDLARHSTGLANPNCIFVGPEGTFSNKGRDHVAMVNALPASNSSGNRFRSWWYYSNAAFGLLGHVIEAVTGTDYSQFLLERILRPLHLSQTLVQREQVDQNTNIAHPYVLKADGGWARIRNGLCDECYPAAMACMGIRSSVNDMLKLFAAILDRHEAEDEETDLSDGSSTNSNNPLRNVGSMWDAWWTRPMEDGFDNDTAYMLGWYRTTMPTAALGLTSYNHHRYTAEEKPHLPFIIGKDSPKRVVYGHNGVTNGSVATAYLLPSSKSAVVVLSNAADAGDASEVAAQIVLQALFDLKPQIDLIPSIEDSARRSLEAHDKMIKEWHKHRDASKYQLAAQDLFGTYVGLNTSVIHIVPSDKAAAGAAVVFGDDPLSRCELEPYNENAVSYLPQEHDELLERSMIDWDYYRVGVFEFVADPESSNNGPIVGLRWQWDQYDWAGFWVKTWDGMTQDEKESVSTKFGKFKDVSDTAKTSL